MNDETQNPLTFATTDELVDELSRRSEALLLSIAAKGEPDCSSSTFVRGNRLMCQGLMSYLRDTINKRRHMADQRAEKEGED
jgi:hypothetical protein